MNQDRFLSFLLTFIPFLPSCYFLIAFILIHPDFNTLRNASEFCLEFFTSFSVTSSLSTQNACGLYFFPSLFLGLFFSRPPQCVDQPDPPDKAQVWGRAGPCGVAGTSGGGLRSDFPLPRRLAGCAHLLEVGTTITYQLLLSWWYLSCNIMVISCFLQLF